MFQNELDYIDFPRKRLSILLEFSDEADDDEVIALITFGASWMILGCLLLAASCQLIASSQ